MLEIWRKKRYMRTFILALIACATLIWVAIDSFDIPPQQMLGFFLAIALGAAVIVALAALAVLCLVAVKRLLKKRK